MAHSNIDHWNPNYNKSDPSEIFTFNHDCYSCSGCERENTRAHIKTVFEGIALTLHIKNGKLVLGKYQSILLGEKDGPKKKEINIIIMGESNNDFDLTG